MTSFTPCNRLGDNITYSMSGWGSGTAAGVLGSSARFGPLPPAVIGCLDPTLSRRPPARERPVTDLLPTLENPQIWVSFTSWARYWESASEGRLQSSLTLANPARENPWWFSLREDGAESPITDAEMDEFVELVHSYGFILHRHAPDQDCGIFPVRRPRSVRKSG